MRGLDSLRIHDGRSRDARHPQRYVGSPSRHRRGVEAGDGTKRLLELSLPEEYSLPPAEGEQRIFSATLITVTPLPDRNLRYFSGI